MNVNTTPKLVRALATGGLTVRRFSASPRLPIGVESRTDMPVLSNHAFVAAWVARRNRLAAAAQLPRRG